MVVDSNTRCHFVESTLAADSRTKSADASGQESVVVVAPRTKPNRTPARTQVFNSTVTPVPPGKSIVALVTTKSSLLSPLKSPTATDQGWIPVPVSKLTGN